MTFSQRLWSLYERLTERAAEMRRARLRRDRELGRPVNQKLERLAALNRRLYERTKDGH
jgi:hypothetical protein